MRCRHRRFDALRITAGWTAAHFAAATTTATIASTAKTPASAHDVLDFSLGKRVSPLWVDFNLSTDNLMNKRYFETRNFFESRLRLTDSIVSGIRGTQCHPFGVTAVLTFRRVGEK